MGISFDPGDVNLNGDSEVTLLRSDGTALLGLALSAASLPVVLATDHIGIPITSPEKTANKSAQGFGFAIDQLQASTGEQDLILFRNPALSGKTVYLSRINIGVVDNITRFRIRLYQKPTVTLAGTPGTMFSLQIKGSPATSAMTVSTLPTISLRGTRIRTYSQADTGSKLEDFKYGVSLAPGYDLLITGDTDASNKLLFASLYWSEE